MTDKRVTAEEDSNAGSMIVVGWSRRQRQKMMRVLMYLLEKSGRGCRHKTTEQLLDGTGGSVLVYLSEKRMTAENDSSVCAVVGWRIYTIFKARLLQTNAHSSFPDRRLNDIFMILLIAFIMIMKLQYHLKLFNIVIKRCSTLLNICIGQRTPRP